MKKFIALIIAALLLSLAGCKGDQKDVPSDPETAEPLRVFIDVEFGSHVFTPIEQFLDEYEVEQKKGSTTTSYKKFKDVITELGGPEDIELELAPKCGNERDIFLTALRTEMMSGKGPDLFITLSGYGNHWDDPSLTEMCRTYSLFQFPQQAMKRNMFLPLDSYIENAQFMEWDKLTPVIMEAGRTDKGQLLLPMTYTVPVGIFKSGDVDFPLDPGLSWRDMLSGPPAAQVSAASSHASLQSAALWPIADYEHDKLALTEEELLEYVAARAEAGERLKSERVPEGSVSSLIPNYWFDEGISSEDELTMIPLYSRSGGYSAVITSFIGINANTKRPDDAFFITDYLMSKEGQQSKLYAHMTSGSAVPTMEGLLSGRGWGVSDAGDSYVYMPENLYKEFVKVRDNISGAEFYTPLDAELFSLYSELFDSAEKPLEELVHEFYMRMNMILAES